MSIEERNNHIVVRYKVNLSFHVECFAPANYSIRQILADEIGIQMDHGIEPHIDSWEIKSVIDNDAVKGEHELAVASNQE